MSNSPPWPLATTAGAPLTACFCPVLALTSHMLPAFSVTNAALVSRTPDPGRNVIAQGELNVATSATAKGRPLEGASALAEGDAPQAARTNTSRVCVNLRVIETVPSA